MARIQGQNISCEHIGHATFVLKDPFDQKERSAPEGAPEALVLVGKDNHIHQPEFKLSESLKIMTRSHMFWLSGTIPLNRSS